MPRFNSMLSIHSTPSSQATSPEPNSHLPHEPPLLDVLLASIVHSPVFSPQCVCPTPNPPSTTSTSSTLVALYLAATLISTQDWKMSWKLPDLSNPRQVPGVRHGRRSSSCPKNRVRHQEGEQSPNPRERHHQQWFHRRRYHVHLPCRGSEVCGSAFLS